VLFLWLLAAPLASPWSPHPARAQGATVSAPAEVAVGAELVVTWTGPADKTDFISLDPAGAPASRYGSYEYASKGSPLTLRAPGVPGEYAVRYHTGASGYPVLASAAVRVVAITATVEVPASVAAGAPVSVTWTGPDYPQDFISIDPEGAAESRYGAYAYTSTGSPLTIDAPVEPGRYVVRYHLGSSGYSVLGSAALLVGEVSASVRPVEPVVAGEPFEVSWTGPDNELDFVTIVPAGAAERSYQNYAYTRRGNPLRLEAPDTPGPYEVRYLTGQGYRTLGSVAVTVRPGTARGRLRVLADGAGGTAGAPRWGAVELVLDASGSMLQRLGSKRRIDLAREALLDLTGSALPAGTPFALRVFGHREAGSCRTDLELPLAPLDPPAAAARIRAVESMNLAKTPIAASLRAVRQDLAAATGPRLVVLVTDGEETCDGDPAQAIEELRAAGIDARIDIVGFAIGELMLQEEFERWARLGGGRYFDAADGDALRRAVRTALQEGFQVLSGSEVVATGTVGGDAVELAPGSYRVKTSSGRDLGAITVVAGQEAELRAHG
jgi:hypothetical protein